MLFVKIIKNLQVIILITVIGNKITTVMECKTYFYLFQAIPTERHNRCFISFCWRWCWAMVVGTATYCSSSPSQTVFMGLFRWLFMATWFNISMGNFKKLYWSETCSWNYSGCNNWCNAYKYCFRLF